MKKLTREEYDKKYNYGMNVCLNCLYGKQIEWYPTDGNGKCIHPERMRKTEVGHDCTCDNWKHFSEGGDSE